MRWWVTLKKKFFFISTTSSPLYTGPGWSLKTTTTTNTPKNLHYQLTSPNWSWLVTKKKPTTTTKTKQNKPEKRRRKKESPLPSHLSKLALAEDLNKSQVLPGELHHGVVDAEQKVGVGHGVHVVPAHSLKTGDVGGRGVDDVSGCVQGIIVGRRLVQRVGGAPRRPRGQVDHEGRLGDVRHGVVSHLGSWWREIARGWRGWGGWELRKGGSFQGTKLKTKKKNLVLFFITFCPSLLVVLLFPVPPPPVHFYFGSPLALTDQTAYLLFVTGDWIINSLVAELKQNKKKESDSLPNVDSMTVTNGTGENIYVTKSFLKRISRPKRL